MPVILPPIGIEGELGHVVDGRLEGEESAFTAWPSQRAGCACCRTGLQAARSRRRGSGKQELVEVRGANSSGWCCRRKLKMICRLVRSNFESSPMISSSIRRTRAAVPVVDLQDQLAVGEHRDVALDAQPAWRIARADDAADDHRPVHAGADGAVAGQQAALAELETLGVDGAVVQHQRAGAAVGLHQSASVATALALTPMPTKSACSTATGAVRLPRTSVPVDPACWAT